MARSGLPSSVSSSSSVVRKQASGAGSTHSSRAQGSLAATVIDQYALDLTYLPYFTDDDIDNNYLEMLVAELQNKLGILLGDDQKATDLDKKEQNRHLLHQAMEQDLNKKVNDTRAHATLSTKKFYFGKRQQLQLNTIATISTLVSAPTMVMAPPLGITFAAAAGIIYLGCITHAIYKARHDKTQAKKLEKYLPREGSQIPAIISLLTVLLVKDEIESEALLHHKSTLTFDFKELVDFLKSLSKSNATDNLIKHWTEEQKAIVNLAKEFSNKIFKNLGEYHKERRLLSDHLDALIPAEIFYRKTSIEVEQDRVCLTAWLAAFDMLLTKEPTHHQTTFRHDIVEVRGQTIMSLNVLLKAQYEEQLHEGESEVLSGVNSTSSRRQNADMQNTARVESAQQIAEWQARNAAALAKDSASASFSRNGLFGDSSANSQANGREGHHASRQSSVVTSSRS